MSRLCPVCGPKCSICCMVLSTWGIIMLGLLGIFFYIGSAALLEDLNIPVKTEFSYNRAQIDEAYRSAAINCWIAAAAYVVTFVVAIWQYKIGSIHTTM